MMCNDGCVSNNRCGVKKENQQQMQIKIEINIYQIKLYSNDFLYNT